MRTLPRVRLLANVIVLAGFAALVPARASAQDAGKWLPWLGCWQSAAERVAGENAVLCVVPKDNGVEAVSVVDDVVTGIDALIGGGANQVVREAGCVGTRRAEWSSRGSVLFVLGEYQCDGRPAQPVHGVQAFGAGPRWIDIQVVARPDAPDFVRVRHYARMGIPTPLVDRLPAGLVARAAEASELASRSPFDVNDIIESSRLVPSSAIESLLLETRAVAPVSRRELLAMDKAAVPGTVIDLMVALTYPEHFDIRGNGIGAASAAMIGPVPRSPEMRAFLNPFAPAEIALPGVEPMDGYFQGLQVPSVGYFNRFRDGGLYEYRAGFEILFSPDGTAGDAGARGGAGPHGRVLNGKGYAKGDPTPTADAGGASITAGSSPAGRDGDASASSSGYSSGSSGSDTGRTAVGR